MADVVRALILFGSGAFTILLLGLGVRAMWDRRWGHVGLDLACAVMIGLILEAVFRVQEIPPDVRSISFMACGFVGVVSAIYILVKGER